MKFLQNLFSNKFYELLFYLLPLCVVSYFLIDTYYFDTKNENIIKQKVHHVKKVKTIKLFDFVDDLEKKIQEENLEIKNLKVASNNLIIDIEGSLIPTLGIIDFVEKYSFYLNIKKASFEPINSEKIYLTLEVELTKSLNHYKNKIAKEFTKNILYQNTKSVIVKNSSEKKQIKICAIIDNNVLIDNTWYKVGSFIDDKKIVLIKSDHIALKQGENIKKIWMDDNELIR